MPHRLILLPRRIFKSLWRLGRSYWRNQCQEWIWIQAVLRKFRMKVLMKKLLPTSPNLLHTNGSSNMTNESSHIGQAWDLVWEDNIKDEFSSNNFGFWIACFDKIIVSNRYGAFITSCSIYFLTIRGGKLFSHGFSFLRINSIYHIFCISLYASPTIIYHIFKKL